jgi:hypothetical protein
MRCSETYRFNPPYQGEPVMAQCERVEDHTGDHQDSKYGVVWQTKDFITQRARKLPLKTENVLQEADRITSGDRRKEYGSVKQSFGTIARLWSTVLGFQVTPMQVALCMIQLKVARQMNGHKRDSLVDIAGYARTAEMLEE